METREGELWNLKEPENMWSGKTTSVGPGEQRKRRNGIGSGNEPWTEGRITTPLSIAQDKEKHYSNCPIHIERMKGLSRRCN